jgi:hypothetical protein
MDLTKLPDNCVHCMVSFVPNHLNINILKECIRVLIPGAFVFFVSNPRQDVVARSGIRMEQAGFRINFTIISWMYKGKKGFPVVKLILVGMKPLSEKTYVDQALKTKTGITWLGKGRIPSPDSDDIEHGRFPANLLVSDDVLKGGGRKDKVYGKVNSYSDYFSLDSWYRARFGTDDENKRNKLREYLKTIGCNNDGVIIDPFNDKYNDQDIIKQLELLKIKQTTIKTIDTDDWF